MAKRKPADDGAAAVKDKDLGNRKPAPNDSKKKPAGKSDSKPMDQMVDDKSDNKTKEYRTTDAKTWQDRYDLAYRNEKGMKKKWGEWYEQMYAIKTYKNIGVWRSQMFIPVISYKAWTVIAKLLALRPGFAVKIFDELYSNEDRKYIEKANLKLEYDYDNPLLDETIRDKELDIFADAVICGTGYGKAEWQSGTRTFYNHFKRDDGTIDYSKAEKIEADYGYNDLEPIDAFDVFSAPGKRSFEAKAWHIIAYTKTKYDLLNSDLYDTAAVEKLKSLGKQRDPITKYKQSKNQFLGETNDDQDSLDDTIDSFRVFECYEKTPSGIYLMTFAEAARDPADNNDSGADDGDNGTWHEIRNEKQPYWHNKYPLVPAYIRRKPHQAYGESIFEVTESMANGYNDIVNQLADNLNIIGNGGILMHDTATTIYDFYYAPGGEVRYSGTKPEFETPTSPDINLFTTMLNLIDSGVTNATVSPYASGTPSDGTDDTQGTAAGINALQEAAGEITSFMKGSIMQFLKGVGQRWLSNNRQFMDDAVSIQTSRYGKKQVYRITSDDFLQTMVCTIDEATMQPSTPDQKRQNDTAWLGSLTTIQDRSFMQAGLIPNPAVPAGQPDPTTGQPAPAATGGKPIMLDWQKIAAQVNENYDMPDIDEFLLSDDEDDQTDNSGMIEAIRSLVEDGTMDGEQAQQAIDLLEGRVPTMAPQISLEGDDNATEQPNSAAGDTSGAARQSASAAFTALPTPTA